MNVLILINDAPYATERPYNALRLATALAGDPATSVSIFLLGDGVWCAVPGEKPAGCTYDIAWLMARFTAGNRPVAACGTCMEARGILPTQLLEGTHPSTLAELVQWTATAGRVLTF